MKIIGTVPNIHESCYTAFMETDVKGALNCTILSTRAKFNVCDISLVKDYLQTIKSGVATMLQ